VIRVRRPSREKCARPYNCTTPRRVPDALGRRYQLLGFYRLSHFRQYILPGLFVRAGFLELSEDAPDF